MRWKSSEWLGAATEELGTVGRGHGVAPVGGAGRSNDACRPHTVAHNRRKKGKELNELSFLGNKWHGA